MTQKEIADELFQAGKEVKNCFLKELSLHRQDPSGAHTSYDQYVQLLRNLNIMYDSLDHRTKATIDIESLMSNAQARNSSLDEKNFIAEFLSALDSLLLNTIKLRENFCVIRRNDRVPGLASHIITNLGQIIVSINNGYLPVIDTTYVDNMFTELSHTLSINAWELYFNQPFTTTLKDIAPDREVTVLEGIPAFMPNYQMDCLMNPALMSFWRNVARKYMSFSSELNKSVSHHLKHLLFGSESKILGVLCRGTDYTNICPYNHPVQPSPEIVLAKTHEYMEKYQCSHCYLATEDQEILRIFQKDLKDRVLTTQEIYYSSDLKDIINQTNIDQSIDIHHKNTEYLTALILLSKCRYFIGGRTSGTVVSLLLSEGFEESYIWDLGRYGIDDPVTLHSYLY